MSDRLRFQGKCLQNDEGWRFMRNFFDELPPPVRMRLAISQYNLCTACVSELARRKAETITPPLFIYFEVIDQMEEEIRREEAA
jgi:hypothetical protein